MEPSIIHNPAALHHEMTLIYKRGIEAAHQVWSSREKNKIREREKEKEKKGVPIICCYGIRQLNTG